MIVRSVIRSIYSSIDEVFNPSDNLRLVILGTSFSYRILKVRNSKDGESKLIMLEDGRWFRLDDFLMDDTVFDFSASDEAYRKYEHKKLELPTFDDMTHRYSFQEKMFFKGTKPVFEDGVFDRWYIDPNKGLVTLTPTLKALKVTVTVIILTAVILFMFMS